MARTIRGLSALALGSLVVSCLVACGASNANTPPPVSSVTTTTAAAPPIVDSPAAAPMGGTGLPPQASGGDAPMVLATPQAGMTKTGVTVNGAPQAASDPGVAHVTDAEIAEVLDAANNGEIAQAREVLTKSDDARVKEFAHHMIADHGKAESKLRAIDAKDGIVPRDSAASDSLKAGGEGVMSSLRSASGLDLDRAYIDAQVDQHKKVLNLIDMYIPQAQSVDLRNHLTEVRTKVAQHLSLAREIQAVLRP